MLAGARVDSAVSVVAVAAVGAVAAGCAAGVHRTGRVAVAVAVDIGVPSGCVHRAIVGHAVAVFVLTVAVFAGAGVDPRVSVVAVGAVRAVAAGGAAGGHRTGRIAIAVAVAVGVPGGGIHRTLVCRAVAIFVQAVAVLAGAGMDSPVSVVAVGAVRTVAAGCAAGVHRAGRVAVAVAVGVGVPGGGVYSPFVRVAVAVVVLAVAVLAGAGVDPRVTVVAVGAVRAVATGCAAGVQRAGRVAISVAVAVGVPGGGVHRPLVRVAIAVIVQPVAGLGAGCHFPCARAPGPTGLAGLDTRLAGADVAAAAAGLADEAFPPVGIDHLTLAAGVVEIVDDGVDFRGVGAIPPVVPRVDVARGVVVDRVAVLEAQEGVAAGAPQGAASEVGGTRTGHVDAPVAVLEHAVLDRRAAAVEVHGPSAAARVADVESAQHRRRGVEGAVEAHPTPVTRHTDARALIVGITADTVVAVGGELDRVRGAVGDQGTSDP